MLTMTDLLADLQAGHHTATQILAILDRYKRIGLCFPKDQRPSGELMADIAPARQELRACIAKGADDVERVLAEFACLYDVPFELETYWVTSGHQAALKLGRWAAQEPWGLDRIQRFLDTYLVRDGDGPESYDWERAGADADTTTDGLQELAAYEVAYHAALLEMEFAKATKAAGVPTWIPDIDFDEQCVLEALTKPPMRGPEIEKAAGVGGKTRVKTILARLVKCGVLESSKSVGYSPGVLYEPALRKAELNGN